MYAYTQEGGTVHAPVDTGAASGAQRPQRYAAGQRRGRLRQNRRSGGTGIPPPSAGCGY